MEKLIERLTQSGIPFENGTPPLRWSTYRAPTSKTVINVRNEDDVAAAIKALNSCNTPFLVQNGGSGWSAGFNVDNGAIINMAALNSFSLSSDKKLATIGGGAKTNETINDAFNNGVQVVTGNCNCVGTAGAYLGAGYGNLIGLHGFGIDNVHSLRVVTARGELKTVSKDKDAELFWGLRGAGPNLGVVTSMTVNAFPETNMNAWVGAAGFSEDKLERVVQLVEDFKLRPETNLFLYFVAAPQPILLVTFFYAKADDATAKAFWKPFFDIGTVFQTGQPTLYPQWNAGAEPFCVRGARKPSYGVGFQKMVPQTWRAIWNEWLPWVQTPGAEGSAVFVECYHLDKAREFPASSAAFPHRNVNYLAVATQIYQDPALDAEANRVGSKIRELWRSTDGLPQNSTYVNVAYGDESNEIVYGSSSKRLRSLKKAVDPQNAFNQWFNIK